MIYPFYFPHNGGPPGGIEPHIVASLRQKKKTKRPGLIRLRRNPQNKKKQKKKNKKKKGGGGPGGGGNIITNK